MEGQINQSKGFDLAYTDRGSGKPVLFIHGYPLNRSMWEPQFEGLSRSARLIAPDLRGFGETRLSAGPDPDPQAYSMELLADDCVGLLEALDIREPVLVCGLSMGGYIAFALYRSHPEWVAGLILAATRASADSPEAKSSREQAIALALKGGSEAIADTMKTKLFSPKTYQDRQELVKRATRIMRASSVDGIVGALKGMKARPDSHNLLPDVQVPVLLLHGADDQIISMDEMQSMQTAIPRAKLVVLPEAGHLLNLEQPAMFNRSLLDFIKSLD